MKPCHVALLGLVAVFTAMPVQAGMEIAANISGGSDYSVQPFKDVWHSARNWKVIPADSDWDYPHGVKADAFATAPYIGGGRSSLSAMRDHITDIKARAVDNRAIADANNVRCITYEGGQHILGTESVIRSVSSDPEIYNVYMEYFTALEDAGVEMLNHFTAVSGWSQYGAWGAKEFVGQSMDEAHKYRALYDFMTASGQFSESEPRYWETYASSVAGSSAFTIPRKSAVVPSAFRSTFGLSGRRMHSPAARGTPQLIISNGRLLLDVR